MQSQSAMKPYDELQPITPDKLHGTLRDILKLLPRRKEWMTCAACSKHQGNGDFRRCTGCAPDKWVFYCDRVCQQEHWPTHKNVCLSKEPKLIEGGGLGASRIERSKFWKRWDEAFKWLGVWAYWQIVKSLPNPADRNFYLLIEFESVDNEEEVARIGKLRVCSFQLVPAEKPANMPGDVGRIIASTDAYIKYQFDGVSQGCHAFKFTDQDELKALREGCALWKCPQWPWIMGMMAAKGDRDPECARFKLCHFLHLYQPWLNDHGDVMSEYIAPKTLKIGDKLCVRREQFVEWQDRFSKVISY